MSQANTELETVFIMPSRAQAEEKSLDEALLPTGARAILSFGEFVTALANCGPRHRTIDALGAKMLLQKVIGDTELSDQLKLVSSTAGFGLAVYDLIGTCKRSGVDAKGLLNFASEHNEQTLAEVAGIYSAYQQLLTDGGPAPEADPPIPLADPFDGSVIAEQALKDPDCQLPDYLQPDGKSIMVLMEDRHELSVIEGRLFMALEQRLANEGIAFVLSMPDLNDRPDLKADWQNRQLLSMPPALGGGEHTLELSRPIDVAEGSLGELQRCLFSDELKEESPPSDENIDLIQCANTLTEAKTVLKKIRKAIDQGVAPEDIAIAAPDWSKLFPIYEDLLRDASLPFSPPGSPGLFESPVSRTALHMLDLVADGFPREALIGLFGAGDGAQLIAPQHALGPNWKDPSEIAELLRRSGVQKQIDRTGATAPYRQHLSSLKNQILNQRNLSPEQQTKQAERVQDLMECLDAFFERLLPLANAHSLSQGMALLRRLLAELGLLPLTEGASPLLQRSQGPSQGDDQLSMLEISTLARDQGAAREMLSLFDQLIRMGRLLGDPTLQPRQLRQLVAEGIQQTRLPLRGARGARITLLPLKRLAGRSFEHVYLVGLNDGQLPSMVPADPFLPDHLKRQYEQGPGMGGFLDTAQYRLDLEAKHLLLAILSARDYLCMSWSKADIQGKELLPSPWIDDIKGSLPQLVEQEVQSHDFKSPERICSPRDLRRHLSYLVGLGENAPEDSILLLAEASKQSPDLWQSLHHRLKVDFDRMGYFLGSHDPGAHVGYLGQSDSLPTLSDVLAGTKKTPMSITHLEDYAKCGFRYLAKRVLRIGVVDEPGEDLDLRQAGNLLHLCLEKLYIELKAQELLPVTPENLPAILSQTDGILQTTAQAWQKTQAHAHSGLFELRRQRISLQIKGILIFEAKENAKSPEKAPIPDKFEQAFGNHEADESALPALEIDNLEGSKKLYLRGTIDRVDVLPKGYRIVDYKSGSATAQGKKLREDALGSSELQLPLYAMAITQHLAPAAPVDALYYALKDSKSTKSVAKVLTTKAWKTAPNPPTLQSLLSLDPQERLELAQSEPPGLNVANRVWEIADEMAAGTFEVKPTSCAFCDYTSACRIMDLADAEDDEASG